MILALDLSTKSTGYAIYNNNSILVESGIIKASSTDVVNRIYKITNQINDLIQKYKIDKIFAEEVTPGSDDDHRKNPHVQKVLLWLQASVSFMLHDEYPELKMDFLYPSEWRRLCGIRTGAGIKRIPLKAAANEFVKEKFNKDVSDDEADAICIGFASFQQESEMITW